MDIPLPMVQLEAMDTPPLVVMVTGHLDTPTHMTCTLVVVVTRELLRQAVTLRIRLHMVPPEVHIPTAVATPIPILDDE